MSEAARRLEWARAWVKRCGDEISSDTEYIAATNALAQAEVDAAAEKLRSSRCWCGHDRGTRAARGDELLVVRQHALREPAHHFHVVLDEQHRPIGTPLKVFQGRMDITDIEIGETIGVTISLESRLVDWERPRVRRFTDQDQKRAFPGDRGLEYVQAVSDMELVWGRG